MNRLYNFVKGASNDIDKNTIEIIGGNRVIIENVDSIVKYSEYVISVSVADKTVDIIGSDLILNNYCKDVIVIKGKIITISFV